MGLQRIESDDVSPIYSGGTKPGGTGTGNNAPDIDLAASEQADADLLDLMESMDALKANAANYIRLDTGRNEFKKTDFYTAYNGKRILADRELTPKIDVVAAMIRRPVAVFRDIVAKPGTNQSSYIEYFIGLTRWADGSPAVGLAINHRNVIAKLFLSRGLDEEREKIYSQISGLQVFSRF